jgi:hypothetical protein
MAQNRRRSGGGHDYLVAAFVALALAAGSGAAEAETFLGAAASATTKSGNASHAAIGLFSGWNSSLGPAIHAWYGFSPGDNAKAHTVAVEAATVTPMRGMGITFRPYLAAGVEVRRETGRSVEADSDVGAIVGAGSLWYFPKHSVLTVAVHYGFAQRAVTARVAISRRF